MQTESQNGDLINLTFLFKESQLRKATLLKITEFYTEYSLSKECWSVV
jgi:hypothetical protein